MNKIEINYLNHQIKSKFQLKNSDMSNISEKHSFLNKDLEQKGKLWVLFRQAQDETKVKSSGRGGGTFLHFGCFDVCRQHGAGRAETKMRCHHFMHQAKEERPHHHPSDP